MPKKSTHEIVSQFKECVNMGPEELEEWLETKESQGVGWSNDGGEAVGHKSGRHIVELLRKDEDDYDDEDLAHMRKVVSYVHRHRAQGPSKDPTNSRWRYSLMNWGNDPLKEQ